MAQTVWVVEQGEYSDYKVVGVFTSQGDAQALADALNARPHKDYDKATIAEWPLNPVVNELRQGYRQYSVRMSRDGTVELSEPLTFIHTDPLGGEVRLGNIWHNGDVGPVRLIACVWAKDEQHAIKIANEHRAQLIANGTWAPDPTPVSP